MPILHYLVVARDIFLATIILLRWISFSPPSYWSGGYHSHHHHTGLVDIFLTTIILVWWNIFPTTLIVVNNPLHYHTLEFVMDIPHHHHTLEFSGLEYLSHHTHRGGHSPSSCFGVWWTGTSF